MSFSPLADPGFSSDTMDGCTIFREKTRQNQKCYVVLTILSFVGRKDLTPVINFSFSHSYNVLNLLLDLV